MLLGFPGGSVVKNLSANVGDTVQSLIQEDPICHKQLTLCTKAVIEPVL